MHICPIMSFIRIQVHVVCRELTALTALWCGNWQVTQSLCNALESLTQMCSFRMECVDDSEVPAEQWSFTQSWPHRQTYHCTNASKQTKAMFPY